MTYELEGSWSCGPNELKNSLVSTPTTIGILNVQEPNDFRTSLATPKSHDMSSNRLVQEGALILVRLWKVMSES